MAIVAALLAIFTESKNPVFLIICLIPVILFCILDAQYLQQEHKFIGMYNDYITGKESRPDVYEMPMKSYAKGFKGVMKALFSWSVFPVYGFTLILIILIYIFFTT